MQTCKNLYILQKDSGKTSRTGTRVELNEGISDAWAGCLQENLKEIWERYMKIVGRGLDRARRELLRGARFAWGGIGAGASRMGWVSHGNTSCGERVACGRGAWGDAARERFHMGNAPHGENLHETRAARKTKSMGKFHKGKIPHGKNPTWENPTWATFHMANIPPTWGTSTVSRRRRINFTPCETKLKQDNRTGPPLCPLRCARFALRARGDGISNNLWASW